MNKKTLIWIGVGVLAAVGIYLLLTSTRGMATGGIPAPPASHAFDGTISQDAEMFMNADGSRTLPNDTLQPMGSKMEKGRRIHVFAQADGMYKIDCDGVWVDQNCVTISPEYRNFTGERLEPEQDLMSGKIF